jgi:transcriptional regulator GlxA family with amidase domain
MENTAVSLEKLFGKDGRETEQKVLNATLTRDRIKIIEKFLIGRLTDAETIDRIIKLTVETILTANGQLHIDEISRQININRRQLERKFSLAIGLSPKQLSRIIRLQTTLKILMNKQFTSLTALAYQGEYYDQAHFIREFKTFYGETPAKLLAFNL